MGFKKQLTEAKERVGELSQRGLTLEEIRNVLNSELEGFYYLVGNRIYCDNVQDYLPAVRIS